MSLHIEIDNVFIPLKPGQTAEIERVNPFFTEGDEWTGEYSSPLSFPYTPDTALRLGHPFAFYTRRVKTKKEAVLHDNGLKRKSVVVSETGKIDRQNMVNSEINGYLLFGLSAFYDRVKDKKLRSLQMQEETLLWTSSDRYDVEFGFWQRIHEAWNLNSYEAMENWIVAPVRNELWSGSSDEGTADWMNKIKAAGEELDYDYALEWNALVPQIRVKAVLEQIFAEAGYTLVMDVEDQDWEKLFMLSLVPFDWRIYNEGTESFNPKDEIRIRLADHLPDRTISDFLIQIGKRYGWRYLINDSKMICRVVSYRKLGKGTRKDWTRYAAATMEPQFNEDAAVFAYSNEIDSNDSYPATPSFDGYTRQNDVLDFDSLPAASVPLVKSIIYTYKENTFWRCELDETNNPVWVFHGDNIFDLEKEDANNTISTTVSTTPMVNTVYRSNGGTDYSGLFPAIKHEANKDFGYRLLFYQLKQAESPVSEGYSTKHYPHLSSLYSVPNSYGPREWSNVWKHNMNGDLEKGIEAYWFSNWAQLRSKNESITWGFYLPQHELLNFEWDDVILVDNIPYIVKSITEQLPYKDYVEAVLHRID